jgi:beta-glucosidase
MYILIIIIAALAVLYFGAVYLFTDKKTKARLDVVKLKDEPWRFGQDFLWGSATAAHQVEGYCDNNNWYRFESAVDAQGRPRIMAGQKAGVGCDHWNRYKEDIKLMKDLSLNAYRFSVEWSKIEPRQGEFDEKALAHYEQVVEELLANGIQPMVTLHHFTDPIWFEEQGAFLKDDSPEIFARFVEKVVARLGNKVKLWCTINEPSVYALQGYFMARFPPAVKAPDKVGIVFRNLLRAHEAAYHAVKKAAPQAQVGLVAALVLYEPARSWCLFDVLLARAFNKSFNESHLDYIVNGRLNFSIPGMKKVKYAAATKESFDFIGLNYYTRFKQKFVLKRGKMFEESIKAPPEKLTDMRWEIYPEGLYRNLKLISGYTSKPVYITENGLADDSDTKRAGFIEDHLRVLNKAIADGMNIKGYFYWSLMDNFEWAFGFTKRFGLYKVDYTTRARTLRVGSRRYPEIIRQNRGQKAG